jgi:hypothetical protein
MTGRDEILGRLRLGSRQVGLPSPWRSRRQFDDLAAQFTSALEAVKGEVHRLESLEDGMELLSTILAQ